MDLLKQKPKALINKVRRNPTESGLKLKEYGKSIDIYDYSENEISEMLFGVYKHSNMLLVDDDYFIDMKNVIQAVCVLENVTYKKKPTLEDFKTNAHNSINNIRTFYVKDYFLITKDKFHEATKHKISRFLCKQGVINEGRNEFRGLYSNRNAYETLQSFDGKKYPKDLFHPIKFYINGLFFVNQYHISAFIVESKIKIEKSY
jgi:hypothetical protein